MQITINPKQADGSKHKALNDLADFVLRSEVPVTIEAVKGDNPYSKKQRGALHLWCTMCAKALNDAGIKCETISVFGNEPLEGPWTAGKFKELVYKRVLEALTGKTSTEDQSTVEPSTVAMYISRQYAQNGLICPAWPSNR